jgi:hypothetical protein
LRGFTLRKKAWVTLVDLASFIGARRVLIFFTVDSRAGWP